MQICLNYFLDYCGCKVFIVFIRQTAWGETVSVSVLFTDHLLNIMNVGGTFEFLVETIQDA